MQASTCQCSFETKYSADNERNPQHHYIMSTFTYKFHSLLFQCTIWAKNGSDLEAYEMMGPEDTNKIRTHLEIISNI